MFFQLKYWGILNTGRSGGLTTNTRTKKERKKEHKQQTEWNEVILKEEFASTLWIIHIGVFFFFFFNNYTIHFGNNLLFYFQFVTPFLINKLRKWSKISAYKWLVLLFLDGNTRLNGVLSYVNKFENLYMFLI